MDVRSTLPARGVAIATHKKKESPFHTGFDGENIRAKGGSPALGSGAVSDAVSDVLRLIILRGWNISAHFSGDCLAISSGFERSRDRADQGGRGSDRHGHRVDSPTDNAARNLFHKGVHA